MARAPRLAVILFDAVSVPLLERLMDEGRLPALAGLRDAGTWVSLDGPSEHLEGSAATTLHSGLRPGEHGVYYPFEWWPERQRLRPRDPDSLPDAVWDRLGRAGVRSLVIDPYDGAPARSVDGLAVCGWGVTNRVTLPRWSSPPALYGELSAPFGRSSRADEIFGGARLNELLRLRRTLLDGPRRVAEATRELLARDGYDLVWIELVAAHLAGHQFWDAGSVIDLSLAGELERAALDSALADVYEATDRSLADILRLLPDDADVIVTAVSGMASERDRSDLLPGMLAAVLGGASGASSNGRRSTPLWSVRAALPGSLREAIARAVPDRAALEVAARLITAGTDWGATRAFAVPNEPCGGIRLNLRGREREGIVDPAEADELMREIEEGLLTFRETDGEPAVAGVERIADVEREGPRSHLLPDLAVRWSSKPSAGVRSAASPELGEISRSGSGSGRSGNHTGNGWAILAPSRSRPRELGRPAEVFDVAATTYALLGADAEVDRLPGEPLLV